MSIKQESEAERLERLDREANKKFRTHRAMRRYKSYRQQDAKEEAARECEAARDKSPKRKLNNP
jgi:hypothetical protein